jgi:hypothetical protein
MTCILVLVCALFYPIYLGKNAQPLFSGIGLVGVLLTIVVPVFIIAQMKICYKTILIDPVSRTISFKMFILPITKTYPFDYFDGYVDTITKDKFGTYKCLYLAKDYKLKYKMSAKFYSNINELQQGLSSLKYIGPIQYSNTLSVNIAFDQAVL